MAQEHGLALSALRYEIVRGRQSGRSSPCLPRSTWDHAKAIEVTATIWGGGGGGGDPRLGWCRAFGSPSITHTPNSIMPRSIRPKPRPNARRKQPRPGPKRRNLMLGPENQWPSYRKAWPLRIILAGEAFEGAVSRIS